ncbi:MAG: hypothetical protein N3G20_12165, partial [Verrucomicrobiae bacterium]|nr:hypothetical protein [Verrucomicrobiae bacterium]
MRKSNLHFLCGLVVGAIVGFWNSLAAEKESSTEGPERQITAALQFPGITLSPDDTFSVDLIIKNRGRRDETVLLEVIEKPQDWTVEIKRYGTIVSGLFAVSYTHLTLPTS